MELLAVSIDVDALRLYRSIHGLGAGEGADDPIFTVALPRFFALIGELGVPATLFVVGADAERSPEAFAPVTATGSEVASHSYGHDYRLTRRPPDEIRDDLVRADHALRPLNLDRPIAGFRAPGYNVSPALLEAVAALGYRYDSSLLPAPLYFAARAAAIGLYRVRRHPSRSIPGDPRQFLGPLEPYPMEPSRAWARAPEGSLIELPMACEPTSRAPLIGTTWALAGERVRRWMLRSVLRKLSCIVLELHAIDLLDTTDHPDLGALAEAQRDLRIPASEKIAAFRALISAIRDTREAVTCATMAERLRS